MGYGTTIPAAAGALQGGAEGFASILEQLTQLGGLLRLDTGLPSRAAAAQQVGRGLKERGQAIFNPINERNRQRGAGAADFQGAAPDSPFFGVRKSLEDFQLESSQALSKSETEADRIRVAGAAHTAATRSMVQDVNNRFAASKQATIEALQNNVSAEVQSYRAANDELAESMVQEGMDELSAAGFKPGSPQAMEMKNKYQMRYAQQTAVTARQAWNTYEDRVADTHARLADTEANLGIAGVRAITEASSVEQDANTRMAVAMGVLRSDFAKSRFEAFNNANSAAFAMANNLNMIDADAAAIDYQHEATDANIQLGAESLLTQGLFSSAGMLSEWSFTVPGFSRIANDSIAAAAGSGGGGGGGRRGFGFGATVAGTGGNIMIT